MPPQQGLDPLSSQHPQTSSVDEYLHSLAPSEMKRWKDYKGSINQIGDRLEEWETK